MSPVVYIGADHAGFRLKEALKTYLRRRKVSCRDLGCFMVDRSDDYPDIASSLSRAVVRTRGSRGILICDSGVGVCITANKTNGIRAVHAHEEKIAVQSRRHNDANVLCIGQDYISPARAQKIVSKWLGTSFSGDARHRRRIAKIKKMER